MRVLRGFSSSDGVFSTTLEFHPETTLRSLRVNQIQRSSCTQRPLPTSGGNTESCALTQQSVRLVTDLIQTVFLEIQVLRIVPNHRCVFTPK